MVNEYNEISYAEYIIKNGFLSKKRMYELGLISKYYVMKGKTDSEIFDILVDFCQNNFEEFNLPKYFDKLKRIIRKSRSVPIHEVNSVKITKNDMDFIASYDGTPRFHTVLFALLVIKKIRTVLNQSPYLNYKYSKLAKVCGIGTTKNIYPIVREMEEMGLIKICRNSNIEILFSVDMTNDSGVLFEVRDFDALYCYYRNYYKLGKYIECMSCGKMTVVSGNRQKYCPKCSREVNIRQTVERKRLELKSRK